MATLASVMGVLTKKNKDQEEQRYIPIDNSGNDYAAMSGMSQADYDALSQAKAQWDAADKAGDQAGKDAAHAAAEALREKYGYSGGQDGSQYIQMEKPTQSAVPTYTEKYQTQIDELVGEILNKDPFSYNYLDDPLYQQYRDAYTREGNRAMLDIMGQAAARTGGFLSTAGMAAAQQAGNYYMSQLGDKIPELQQLAYQMYMNDADSDRTNLSLLQGLENVNYNRYLDQLGQFNTDRNFDYNAWRDLISDGRYEDETAWNRALQRAQLLAGAGDYSGYGALGYSDADIATLQAYQQLLAQQSNLKKYSGGGGGDSNLGTYDLEGLFQAAYDSGNPYTFLKQSGNYKKYGLSSAPVTSEYDAWLEKKNEVGRPDDERYSAYDALLLNAKRMLDYGKSKEYVLSYLDQYGESAISDADLERIIRQLGL